MSNNTSGTNSYYLSVGTGGSISISAQAAANPLCCNADYGGVSSDMNISIYDSSGGGTSSYTTGNGTVISTSVSYNVNLTAYEAYASIEFGTFCGTLRGCPDSWQSESISFTFVVQPSVSLVDNLSTSFLTVPSGVNISGVIVPTSLSAANISVFQNGILNYTFLAYPDQSGAFSSVLSFYSADQSGSYTITAVVGNGFGIGYGPTLYANASLNFVVVAGGNNSTLPNTTEITNQTLIQNSSQVSTNFPQTTTQITTSNSSQDVFSLNLFTDQSSYQQGQAVILFGNVTLNGQVISPDRGVPDRGKGVISITSDIPNFHSGTFTIYTDGSFSIMPFAAWSVGSHSFLGRAFVTTANGRHQVTDIVDFAVTPFPTLTDIGPQLQAIEELYNGTSTAPGVTAIPEGPIWTNPAYSNVRSEIPVATYGDYENLFIAGGPNDKGSNFVCGGYQAQVLKFFNSIRFNSDPNVRALLNGIDYGPVERGYGIFGGHHAVAVYPIGLDWNTILPPSYVGQETKIFDPWVYQQPNVESVPSFVAGWGFPKADGYYAATPDDPFGGKGYPITGNPVYQNDGPNGIVLPLLSPQNPQISVHIGSPVGALITNSEGQKTGMLPDGTLVQEFPAEVNQRFDSDNQTSGWYIGLYNNDTYTISLTGLRSNSSFNLEIGNAANPGVVLDYGERSVLAGQSAQLSVNNNADSNASQSTPPKLFMPDGSSVSPTVVLAPSNSGSQTSSGASGLIGLAITAGFVALIVSALWRRRKSH